MRSGCLVLVVVLVLVIETQLTRIRTNQALRIRENPCNQCLDYEDENDDEDEPSALPPI